MMKQWTLILLILLGSLLPSGAANTSDLDDQIGRLYLGQSRLLFQNGELDGAWGFVRRASEYIPESREFLLLSIKILLEQGRTGEALELAGHQFQREDELRREWDRLRLPLLVQTKQYRETEDIHRLWGDRIDWTPGELFLIAQAYIGLGKVPDMVSLLEGALERYPRENSLLGLLLSYSEESRIRYARRLLQGEFPSREREDEILLLLLPLGTVEEFPPLWRIYQGRGLFSLEGELRRGELFGWEEGPPWESFVKAGLFKDGLLTGRFHQWLLFNEDLTTFNQYFSEFSGIMSYDYNHDGWAEATVSYEEGRIEEIHQDPNQDGVPEASLIFEEGIPKTLNLNRQNAHIRYRSYPWVEEILHKTAEGSFRYSLGEERYIHSLEGWEPIFAPPDVGGEVDWEILRERALGVSFQPSRSPGELWSAENLLGGEGRTKYPAHGAKGGAKQLLTREGTPYQEEIFFLDREDPDTVIYYQEGLIREIRHDADGDGVFEYSEGFPEPREPEYRKIFWDIDGNGDADIGESLSAEGRVRLYPAGEGEASMILLPKEGD